MQDREHGEWFPTANDSQTVNDPARPQMISTVCRRDHLRYCTYALPDCCRLTVAPHQTLKGVGGGGQLWSLCFNFVVFLTTSCYAGTYVVLASSVTIRHTLAISTCALIQKKTYFVWTCKVVEMHAPTTTRLLVHKATAAFCSQLASKPTVWQGLFWI